MLVDAWSIAMPDVDTARVIKEHLAAVAMTRKELATRCKVSDKTIQRVLKGDFSEVTLLRIKAALNMRCERPQEDNTTTGHLASVVHGSYMKLHHQRYVGDYLCYQRCPFDPGLILVSHLAISWSDEQSCLTFHETCLAGTVCARGSIARGSRGGEIHIDCLTGHLHFLHRCRGRVRLMITCPLRLDIDETMRGMVLGMSELGPLAFPAAAAIVIAKQEAGALSEEQLALRLGLRPIGDDLLREAGAKLVETERLYAFLGRMAKEVDITSLSQESPTLTVPPPQLLSPYFPFDLNRG
jgi:hypothetical protein